MRVPYVIDNQSHRLADILAALLGEHRGNPSTWQPHTSRSAALAHQGCLLGLGNLRLILGQEPATAEEVGLRADPPLSTAAKRDPAALKGQCDNALARLLTQRQRFEEELAELVEDVYELNDEERALLRSTRPVPW